MGLERKLRYLHENRIILSCFPWSDEPTETHYWGWYFKYGTYQRYDLFSTPFKIVSYKSLKWHLLVLRFLNQEIPEDLFISICEHIAKRENNFTTFTVNKDSLSQIVDDVLNYDYTIPPYNKKRKVIFKIGTGLSKREKLKIVGELIGNKCELRHRDIHIAMEKINREGFEVTNKRVAKELGCSVRTLQRNMTDRLRKSKDELNLHNEVIR